MKGAVRIALVLPRSEQKQSTEALVKTASLRVLVLNGYYDLATPFSSTEYVMAYLGLPPGLGARIEVKYYEASHMMYVHPPLMAKMKRDIESGGLMLMFMKLVELFRRLRVRTIAAQITASELVDVATEPRSTISLKHQRGSASISADKRAEIQHTMQGNAVLDVEHFPEISYCSTAITKTGNVSLGGARESKNLHGENQPVVVVVSLEAGHYRGSASFQQSNFGINRIRIAGGTVKVKDEIKIEFGTVPVDEEIHVSFRSRLARFDLDVAPRRCAPIGCASGRRSSRKAAEGWLLPNSPTRQSAPQSLCWQDPRTRRKEPAVPAP